MRTLLKLSLPLVFAFASFGAYSKVYTINFDHTQITANLTNFPNHVCANGPASPCNSGLLVIPELKTIANGGVVTSANCYDCTIHSNSSCTALLPFELAPGYNAVTGAAQFHVAYARSSSVDDKAYLCLGNAAVTTYQGAVTTWTNSSYQYVFHWESILTGGGIPSFAIQNSAIALGSAGDYFYWATTPTFATGAAFNGLATGTSKGASSGDGSYTYPNGGAAWTMEAWIKDPNSATAEVLFGIGGIFGANGQRADFYWDPTFINNRLFLEVGGNGYSSIPWTPDGSWHHFAVVYPGGGAVTTAVLWYKDGVLTTSTPGPTTTDPFIIDPVGGNAGMGVLHLPGSAQFFWLGDGDELRLNSTALTAAWLAATYKTITSPQTFYTFTVVTTTVKRHVGMY